MPATILATIPALSALFWFDGEHLKFMGVFTEDRIEDAMIADMEQHDSRRPDDYLFRPLHLNRIER